MQSAIVVVTDYRTKMFMKKYVGVRKIEKVVVVSGSRGLQKTELQDLQLGVVMYSLTLRRRRCRVQQSL